MEIIRKIQKKETLPLLKVDCVKNKIKEDSHLLTRYQIDLKVNNDDKFFYFECLCQTLKNKEMLEGAFVKSFDDMYDYWQSLNYNERKHLINRDMESTWEKLSYVLKDGHRYYVPCMNDRINEIYESEMVLFELKQYNRLRFDCKDMIDKTSLTIDLLKAGFSSLHYLKGDEEDCWAYCPLNHGLYHLKYMRIQEVFPFVLYEGNGEELLGFIEAFEKGQEEECISILLEGHYLSEKMEKKCQKLVEKRKK